MRNVATPTALAAAGIAGLAACLAGAAPGLSLSAAGWQARIAADPTNAVALAAATLLWILLAVLALGVLTTAAARLPGAAGRLCDRISRAITPAIVRRAVNLTIGATLTVGAMAPATSFAGTPSHHAAPTTVTLSSPIPVLGEPGGPVTESTVTAPPPQVAASATPPPTARADDTASAAAASTAGPVHASPAQPAASAAPTQTAAPTMSPGVGKTATPVPATPSSAVAAEPSQVPPQVGGWWATQRPAAPTNASPASTTPTHSASAAAVPTHATPAAAVPIRPAPTAAAPTRPAATGAPAGGGPDQAGQAAPLTATPPAGTTTNAGPGPAAGESALVAVRPGDCLWTLADRGLGGHASAEQIAAEWPRWWAANRAAIGANPDLLQPGEQLRPPT